MVRPVQNLFNRSKILSSKFKHLLSSFEKSVKSDMMNKPTTVTTTVKLLCSYGGRILPRPSDGQLRYVGGHTRVVSVLRSVSFSELTAKLSEMCGGDSAVVLRCQLPSEEMDVLVSIKSDEDLVSIIDEYDRASLMAGKELKVKAILSPPRPPQTKSSNSSPSSSLSYTDLSPTKSDDADHRRYFCSTSPNLRLHQSISPPSPIGYLADSRSGSSKFRLSYKFDSNPIQFQPCHMQAHYKHLALHSNYRQ